MDDTEDFRTKEQSVVNSQTKRLSGSFLILGALTVLAVLALDQGTKLAIEARLPIDGWIDILPILALYHVHNAGLLFSAFADTGLELIVVPLIAALVVVVFLVRAHDRRRITAAAFGLILGGAIGNLVDRAYLGYVIDFLSVHIGEHVLFVLNFADMAVIVGLLLLTSISPFRKRPLTDQPR